MIRMLFILLVLLASVLLGIFLQKDPGYVLISFHKWTIETTLWVAIIGFIFVFFALHFFTSFLSWVLGLPSAWKRWLAKRRIKKARAKTRQGLIEFSEGHWQNAKNHLIKALPGTDTPLLNYLTAARAAQELEDYELRDNYLREAQQSMPEAKIAVELTQAQLQLANQQWEQALATLKHLQDLAPNHTYVLKLLMKLYEQVRDWPQLIALLPELRRHQVVTGDDYLRLQQHAYLEALRDFIKHKHSEAVDEFFITRPKALAYNPEIIAVYSRYLLEQQRDSEAETFLRRTLVKQFNEELITLYGKTKGAKLKFAEERLKEHPHSPALLLCLGRLSKAKNLWGKARSYFENSIQLSPSPEAYLELGTLLEYLNDREKASEAFHQGLLLRTSNKDLQHHAS
ncbi:heme biosynthesis HemY N-terminal domain-containing protein [Legionella yabuuchiae]|uniref:heme biosynthesis HemY N-terminal domain-containing protein n=1 Tax=Legionella yabuuchiae TaxID=376727 RepID=UPI001056BA0E|nr:heme biosynthesis HemY N-terminal domain-containing protein [Legionella yabuuchiae]